MRNRRTNQTVCGVRIFRGQKKFSGETTNEEAEAELAKRLERLKPGLDSGLSFQETFGKPM
jgi:hypothetical protein